MSIQSTQIGYRIRGIEPTDLSTYPDRVKLMFCSAGRVDLGGCPPRSPTDPGLLTSCAPGSSSHKFATRAIRRRYVDMVQVSMYLPGFSSTAHETAPPSLDGVPRVGSPAWRGQTEFHAPRVRPSFKLT